ncbi:MAG TPA: hypothetical protein VN873_09780 [Candidatus Angelobacter sp.]|nr:hypothetical protein [Candidatus Angelobacter sp.]
MKTKLLTALCALTLLSSITPAAAQDEKMLDSLADVALVRPGCMVATVGGTALFIVALPFAAMSKSVKKTAHALVVTPAKAAFNRPVGDFTSLEN